MSKEDVFTLFRFHLWLKIHFRKKQCVGEIIVSNYCLWLYSILLNREQMVNAIKQPTEVFYKKNCSYKFDNIHRNSPVLEYLFNKVAVLKVCNFIEKRPEHRYTFLWILRNFEEYLFCRISANVAVSTRSSNWRISACLNDPPEENNFVRNFFLNRLS